ncbi:MAG: HAMP domain-containing protein [Candidatus Hydrogenedentes bacterium]|nr:HAMP domain-containing protein [Candidatus Hydrogenedentota bacterium]
MDIKSTANRSTKPLRPSRRREHGADGKGRDAADNGPAPEAKDPIDQILDVVLALRSGDFTRRLPNEWTGTYGKIADALNDVMMVVERRGSEFSRISHAVGKQGRLSQRISVPGAVGSWADGVDDINALIDDLVWPTMEITRAVGAVARGDLSQTMSLEVDGRPLEGEFLRSARLVSTMMNQLAVFTSEVTRVAREVGTDGRLGGQAQVEGVSGVWKELTESVNSMASNLTAQVRNIAEVTIAVANGDLSKKITVDVRGEILQQKEAMNGMVDQLRSFASEVTRVAREVGTDGNLGGQAVVPGAAGTWKDLTDNVNLMAANLTTQVRNITEVTIAVARGDLSRKITVDVRGELLELKDTINTMVEQLRAFAFEVSRVAREVGTEGRLGGQADVPGVAGTWKDLTDNVNSMASNLTAQVRNIAEVTTAVARGDLSRKITADAKGEILELKDTINTMVDQLNAFASEVSRVAREVGTDGKLGGQAEVQGVAGTWKDLTDNVNSMASNLTSQVRNIAEVTTAVARGDLSRTITADAKGEILELKETINTMVDQLNAFASEVSRVAREVGTDGKLGGQADVPGVAGTWKDLTDNVNSMASNLTAQVRNIAEVTTAVARGDLSRTITVDVSGELLQLKETINTMVEQLRGFASEVTRVAREVGTDGKLGGQATVPGVAGTWKDLTDNVNSMASNLTSQVRNIAEVTTAVARGDLSRKIVADAKGEILELKNTINTMVDQLNAFAAEVTRVAREVGTDGKLGGQATVPGVAGTWKDLTDNVNSMATNLTDQVRGIVKVVTAVAEGNLEQKLTVEAKGEIAALAETINNMTDTLATFAQQVTNVAREVGVDGRLGGQANVPGASGTWKDLTGNVNLLAANLSTQVRAIAEVATAVTQGDLTRSIQVEASGEVATLKDNVNTMIHNLRVTTERNLEQDWLKTNLAKFAGMLQGQRDLFTVGQMLLSELVPLVNAQQGVIYQMVDGPDPFLRLLAGYAQPEDQPEQIRLGKGLAGQCAIEKKRIILTDVPSEYTKIHSGLGSAYPESVVVIPTLFEGETKAVIELASLGSFTATHLTFLDQLTLSIGVVFNTIEATMQTENLLQQSQQLTSELQAQKRELQQTNEELEEKARLLADQNVEVERKNEEVELARRALEEKAAELALTSKYKSEFLANMSHELRTPLNSILILGQQLAENSEGNLNSKQIEFARNMYSAGSELLSLINEILDLSKIESGTVTIELEELPFAVIREGAERDFRHVAESKNIEFLVELESELPPTMITDPKRVQQILKNLLSNAFKFTSTGEVCLRIGIANEGWNSINQSLNAAASVVAFTVSDTGIGIPPEKQKLIFEAFQQADAGTSRKYGGTGLGLAICREQSVLLGGEITVASSPEQGSTFTLFLPLQLRGAESDILPPPVAEVAPLPASRLLEKQSDEPIPDDRDEVGTGDLSVLVIEDDRHYAEFLYAIARETGFKVLIATNGDQGLRLVQQYQPSAIAMDIFLPDTLGWTLLNQLKNDLSTRHIPILLISGDDDRRHDGIAHGAFSFLQKPATAQEISASLERMKDFVSQWPKRLLVVEDDHIEGRSIVELLAHDDLEIAVAPSGADAMRLLASRAFECCVLDLRLPDMSGLELLDWIQKREEHANLPIIVFTGKELAASEETALRAVAKSIVLKDVRSPERLFDETALFLHRNVNELPRAKRDLVISLQDSRRTLRGRTALVVDDDVRNIFALLSVLENQGMEVLTATDGRQAMDLLHRTPHVEVVLLDIMMPEMDGFETMREIRTDARYASLPILALTAKAMKGDREKCLEAGASDYIAKPVNVDHLLSLLRVWLKR